MDVRRLNMVSFDEFVKGVSISDYTGTHAIQLKPNHKEPTEMQPSTLNETADQFKARAIRIFNAADTDGSGTIDETELHNLLQVMFPNITKPGYYLIIRCSI
jgi:hypothetical protein